MGNFNCGFGSNTGSCPSNCDDNQWRYQNIIDVGENLENWILDPSIRISTGKNINIIQKKILIEYNPD